ncbi:hypothetical protein GCM10010307_38850 [Streptomyces vastus]|uniref:Uncharacterized protein n=1 Tax=Streptomyces vastus TaxID=285451 RepID=A0ABN3R0E2_9ACTN
MLRTGVPATAYGVGGGAQRVQRGVTVEVERLLRGDPPTLGGTVEDGLKVGLSGHRGGPFPQGVDGLIQRTPALWGSSRQAANAPMRVPTKAPAMRKGPYGTAVLRPPLRVTTSPAA